MEALARAWAWTSPESAGYAALRDRLVLAAALDSALADSRAALAAAGDSAADPQALGVAARDRAVGGMGLVFDPALLDRLAAAWASLPLPTSDSSVAAQLAALCAMPRVGWQDSLAVIARSGHGDYRVQDLLSAWQRLSPAYRPRIASADQIRGLVENGMFERALREEADRRGLERRPEIEAALARARERIAVEHLIEREVLGSLAPDRPALERFHDAHRERWALPLRVRVLRLAVGDRQGAERLALRLMDPAQAESLETLARRHGLDYAQELTAGGDGARFQAALAAGTGTVLAPEERDGTWWVTRVDQVLPGRARSFEEVRTEVERAWTSAESERRTRALCDRLRKRTRVRVNRRALEGAAIRAEERARLGTR